MHQALSIILVVCSFSLWEARSEQRVCGKKTDPCMNDENWEICEELVRSGCRRVLTMESCPLQFACVDSNEGTGRSIRSEGHNDDEPIPPPPGPPEPPEPFPNDKPNACASLYVYADRKCTGKPLYAMSFPTWTHRGSPCWHDATMAHFSVKDQYCNMKTGNWHETVYMGSEQCSTGWWNWWKPFDLTFTTDSCIAGFRLKSCRKGPCKKDDDGSDGGDGPDDENDGPDDEEAIQTIVSAAATIF